MQNVPDPPKPISFDFQITENNDIKISEQISSMFTSSNRLKIVFILGPTRAGKSLLLDYLSVQNLEKINKSGVFKKTISKLVPFKVESGENPVTIGFHCIKLPVSTFKQIHKIPIDLNDDNDYDIVLIDSEGFNSKGEKTDNILIAMFSIIGISSIILDISIENFKNTDRLERMRKNLIVSSLLSIEGNLDVADYIGIQRGEMIKLSEDEEEDVKGHLDEIDLKFKTTDKEKEDSLNEWMRDRVVLGKHNLKIVTMPNISTESFDIYKCTLANLASMIVNKGKVVQGELKLKIFLNFGKIIASKYSRELKGVSINQMYIKFIQSKLNLLASESFNIVEKLIIQEISNLTLESKENLDKIYNGLVIWYKQKAFETFEEMISKELKQKLTKNNGSDNPFYNDFKDTIKIQKDEIEEHIKKNVKYYLEIQTMGVIEKNTQLFYNEYKINISPREIKKILIKGNRKGKGKEIELKASEKSFSFNNENYHYLFPTNLNIYKICKVKERKYLVGLIPISEEKTSEKMEDYTNDFNFDPIEIELIPNPRGCKFINTKVNTGVISWDEKKVEEYYVFKNKSPIEIKKYYIKGKTDEIKPTLYQSDQLIQLKEFNKEIFLTKIIMDFN